MDIFEIDKPKEMDTTQMDETGIWTHKQGGIFFTLSRVDEQKIQSIQPQPSHNSQQQR